MFIEKGSAPWMYLVILKVKCKVVPVLN